MNIKKKENESTTEFWVRKIVSEAKEEERKEIIDELEELTKERFASKHQDVIHWFHIRKLINKLKKNSFSEESEQ